MTLRSLKLKSQYPFFLANRPEMNREVFDVTDKFSQKSIAQVSAASVSAIEKAIHSGVKASSEMANLSLFSRKKILQHCANRIQERKEEFAQILTLEVGKTIRDARGEVDRMIETFSLAFEEAGKLYGEVSQLDRTQRGVGYQGFWKRVPVGLCSFISPFNFPLNLTAHKIAPAIATGCPFILKPASRTPISSLLLGEILAETELPEGAFSILPCSRENADLFTLHDSLKLISFTGSPDVGWKIKSRSGKKKVVLELGGNAACIVDETAQIDDAIPRLILGAFSQAGQSCISVQRILIQESIYEIVKEKLVGFCRTLKTGDPKEETTDIGPLISEEDAIRLENWIKKAESQGAQVLCGGKRKGSVLEPTLLEKVPSNEPLSCEEAFGPVAILEPYKQFSEALSKANEGRFGLQAGVFTQNLNHAMQAWNNLEVGGVVINEVPSWRSDAMPYGGIKDSGLGREGVRFAMEELTEIRSLVMRQIVDY